MLYPKNYADDLARLPAAQCAAHLIGHVFSGFNRPGIRPSDEVSSRAILLCEAIGLSAEGRPWRVLR
jgi:hypothetical protein